MPEGFHKAVAKTVDEYEKTGTNPKEEAASSVRATLYFAGGSLSLCFLLEACW